jgi:hypothetical protein
MNTKHEDLSPAEREFLEHEQAVLRKYSIPEPARLS